MMGLFTLPWLVQTLLASTMLMALVLALRETALRSFGPRIAYALWLLPALRMILPALPGWRTLAIPVVFLGRGHSTVGLVDPLTAITLARAAGMPAALAPQAILHVGPAGLNAIGAAPVTPMVLPPPGIAPLDIPTLALVVWLAGAVLLFVWQVARYRLFLRRALRGATLLACECGIDVLISNHVTGPVAAGILRRRILLPADVLSRYTSAERRLALKHEAAHHDRLDLFANLAALVLLSLHWWNPLAWKAYRAFRADQELACDATVLANAAAGERFTYGSAMLKSASGGMPTMACALSHKDQLKTRIRMMAKAPIATWRLLCGSALAISAIGGGLLLTASGQARPMPAPPVLMAGTGPGTDAEPTEVEEPREPMPARIERANAGRLAIDAEHQARLDARQAAGDSRQAQRDAAIAARDGTSMARHATEHMPDVAALVNSSLDQARAELASSCAARGVIMPRDSEFGKLATCGMHLHDTVLASLREARRGIVEDREMDENTRAQAIASIDIAIVQTDRSLKR